MSNFEGDRYDPEWTRKLQDELNQRDQEKREINSIESPFLRGLMKALTRIDFGLKHLSLEGLMHEEKMLDAPELREYIERERGYAHQEASELNKKYDELRARAKEGIAKIKALDENQEASALCAEAMSGVEAILELRNFEEKVLGMRQVPGEERQDSAA